MHFVLFLHNLCLFIINMPMNRMFKKVQKRCYTWTPQTFRQAPSAACTLPTVICKLLRSWLQFLRQQLFFDRHSFKNDGQLEEPSWDPAHGCCQITYSATPRSVASLSFFASSIRSSLALCRHRNRLGVSMFGWTSSSSSDTCNQISFKYYTISSNM